MLHKAHTPQTNQDQQESDSHVRLTHEDDWEPSWTTFTADSVSFLDIFLKFKLVPYEVSLDAWRHWNVGYQASKALKKQEFFPSFRKKSITVKIH